MFVRAFFLIDPFFSVDLIHRSLFSKLAILVLSLKIIMKKRPFIILSLITVLLILPLIAMQFTNQVNWSVGDFIVMAMLLFGTGVLCEFAIRRITTISYRYLTIVLILTYLGWTSGRGIRYIVWAIKMRRRHVTKIVNKGLMNKTSWLGDSQLIKLIMNISNLNNKLDQTIKV